MTTTTNEPPAIARIHKRDTPYVVIDKRTVDDARLSWKARGILLYLLSKPHDWEVRIADIVNRGPEGRDAVQSAFRELQDAGYAVLVRERGENRGQLWGSRWMVAERPELLDEFRPENHRQPENPVVGAESGINREPENPAAGKPAPTKERRSVLKKEDVPKTEALFELTDTLPGALNRTDILDAWECFKEERKAMKKPLTERAAKMIVDDLVSWGPDAALAALKASITNRWAGVFKPKNGAGVAPQKTPVTHGNVL